MENSIKNNVLENVSVSNIYETLKSRKFLEELYSDMLSDIKEKPTYNRIKDMVLQLVTQKSTYLSSSCQGSERLARKTQLADISMLAYTIDTIISKVLFNKMQNDFVTYVTEMIEDFTTELNTTKNGACDPNKNSNHADASNERLPSTTEDKIKTILNADSGSDSEQSDCSISLCSVSSVHTSDLSSYDDVISISSEDEENSNKKRKISVKEASELFFKGRVEEIHKIGRPAKQQKRVKKKPKIDTISSPLIESPSRKSLPARIRKPNSKYSSEDIICPMKVPSPNLDQLPVSESSSPPKSSPTGMKDSPSGTAPKRKRGRPRKEDVKILYSNSNVQSNAATEDLDAIKNSNATMMLQANGDQRKNSPEMNKPQTTYSSKGKTAYTMFSTK